MPNLFPSMGSPRPVNRISRFWGEKEQTQNLCDMSSCHA